MARSYRTLAIAAKLSIVLLLPYPILGVYYESLISFYKSLKQVKLL